MCRRVFWRSLPDGERLHRYHGQSKKDGKDGEYYCINGGTISGTSGSCQCTCAGGFEGDHCEDRKICTNTTDTTKTTGADGKFYGINGGTVGGFAESCTCRM